MALQTYYALPFYIVTMIVLFKMKVIVEIFINHKFFFCRELLTKQVVFLVKNGAFDISSECVSACLVERRISKDFYFPPASKRR